MSAEEVRFQYDEKLAQKEYEYQKLKIIYDREMKSMEE